MSATGTQALRTAVRDLLQRSTAYDLLPESGKVIVLDNRLSIQASVLALLENGIRSAPVVDPKDHRLTGMFTVSDFIDVIVKAKVKMTEESENEIAEDSASAIRIRRTFEEMALWRWQRDFVALSIQQEVPNFDEKMDESPKEGSHFASIASCSDELMEQDSGMLTGEQRQTMPSSSSPSTPLPPPVIASPSASLLEVIERLWEHRVHRLPVVDDTPAGQIVLQVLQPSVILRFIAFSFRHNPDLFREPLRDLQIGTVSDVITVRKGSSLFDTLRLLHQHRITSLPVVDDQGRVTDVFSRADVLHLAHAGVHSNLSLTVEEALQHRPRGEDALHTLYLGDSLRKAVFTLARHRIGCVVIVDMDLRIEGIITVNDILHFFTLPSK